MAKKKEPKAKKRKLVPCYEMDVAEVEFKGGETALVLVLTPPTKDKKGVGLLVDPKLYGEDTDAKQRFKREQVVEVIGTLTEIIDKAFPPTDEPLNDDSADLDDDAISNTASDEDKSNDE